MTTAQIKFRDLEEQKRHYREQEAISREQITQAERVAELQAATSQYVANTSAAASRYATDTASSDRARQLEFDKTVNSWKKHIADAELDLKSIDTETNKRYRDKQIERLQAEINRDLEHLGNEARDLDMKEVSTKADAALKKSQRMKTDIESTKTAFETFRMLVELITGATGRVPAPSIASRKKK